MSGNIAAEPGRNTETPITIIIIIIITMIVIIIMITMIVICVYMCVYNIYVYIYIYIHPLHSFTQKVEAQHPRVLVYDVMLY